MFARRIITRSLTLTKLRSACFSTSPRTLGERVTSETGPRTLPRATLESRNALTDSTPSDDLSFVPTMPDGKPKRRGKILEDLLDIVKGRNVEDTLNFVDKYSEMMNTHHVYRCYGNIHRELPLMQPEVIADLRKDTRFQKLCILAGKKATFFGPTHCVFMIRNLVDLGFESDSILLQMFLELSKHHINDLSITNIAMLGNYLVKLESTEQIRVLKKGLAVAVDNNFALELKYLRTDTIIDLFEAFGSSVNEETLKSLIWNLKIRKDSRHFSKPEVVLKTLAEIDVLDKDLIKICCKILRDCLDLEIFDARQVYMVANALSHFKYYSASTLVDIANYTGLKKFGLEMELKIVHSLMDCGYFPLCTVERCLEDVRIRAKIDSETLYILNKIVDNSDGIIDSDTVAEIRNRCHFSELENFEFGSNHEVVTKIHILFPALSNSEIVALTVHKSDYFKNIAKLRGPQFRAVQKLINEGKKILLLSEESLKYQPEQEIVGILERKYSEVMNDGFAQLL